MSGTSLDGVDAALIETDGTHVQRLGRALTIPYEPGLRRALRQLIDHGEQAPPDLVANIEDRLTLVHADAVAALGQAAELIGFHGQTILHAPHRRRTRQIGDAAQLARITGIPVACDFRLADVAAGGQGAPLVPVFHAALAEQLGRPLLVVNIGGVANFTWIGADGIGADGIGADGIGADGIGADGIGADGIGADGALLAGDTGPGCALLDDFIQARTGATMDRDGALGAAGVPQEAILAQLLADPFFARPAPKSLDRQHFAAALDSVAGLSTADGAATLAAFTARAIAGTRLPGPALRVLVCGGGRHNPAIMRALADAMPVPVSPVEAVGWDGDALEAQCFGFLAARVAAALPLSFPNTTGVPQPMPGGRIVLP